MKFEQIRSKRWGRLLLFAFCAVLFLLAVFLLLIVMQLWQEFGSRRVQTVMR